MSKRDGIVKKDSGIIAVEITGIKTSSVRFEKCSTRSFKKIEDGSRVKVSVKI